METMLMIRQDCYIVDRETSEKLNINTDNLREYEYIIGYILEHSTRRKLNYVSIEYSAKELEYRIYLEWNDNGEE